MQTNLFQSKYYFAIKCTLWNIYVHQKVILLSIVQIIHNMIINHWHCLLLTLILRHFPVCKTFSPDRSTLMGVVWNCVRACQPVCWLILLKCKALKQNNFDKFCLSHLDLKLCSYVILSETTKI